MAEELSFLSGGDTAASQPAPELSPVIDAAPGPEPTPEPPPAAEGQPLAPDGTFASKGTDTAPAAPVATDTAPPPVAPVAPVSPAPVQPEPGHVPIGAMLEERDRRRELQRENEELKAKLKPAEPATPRPLPDVLDDPKGYQSEMDRRIAEQAFETRRDFSWRFAVKEHGAETMATVKDWAAAKAGSDPHFNLQLLQSEDLYETAVTAWRQEQLLAKVKDVDPADFDAFLAWKAGQTGGQVVPAIPQAIPPAAPAATPPTPPPTPPPASLAALPSAGGDVPVVLDDSAPFKALFHR